MGETVLKVENVGMKFNLSKEKHDSLKEYFIALVKGELKYNEFWALRDITFTLECTLPAADKLIAGTETATWTIKDVTPSNVEFVQQEDGTFKITIDNNKGTELPSTGGIGTTIFYVLGTVLVLGAAVLLISKRRMNVR